MAESRTPIRFRWRVAKQRHPRIFNPAGYRIDLDLSRPAPSKLPDLPADDRMAERMGLGEPEYRKPDTPR